MQFSQISKMSAVADGGPEVDEVLRVFERLYQDSDSRTLPSRAIIRPYTADAEFSNFRENTPQWEEVDGETDRSYGEIFSEDIMAVNAQLSAAVRHPIVDAICTPDMTKYYHRLVPPRMSIYAPWIVDDFVTLLQKRLAFGRAPSLLEDLFLVYRAGYFSFGWTGLYPNDVKFLVFPGTNE